MSAGHERILSPFTGRKKQKAWNNTREKYMPEERRQSLAEIDRGSYYNQEKWIEEFLDDKNAFYNGSESDDRDGGDANYNENLEAVVHTRFSKWVFLKILQITQENTCVGVLLKTDSNTGVFL